MMLFLKYVMAQENNLYYNNIINNIVNKKKEMTKHFIDIIIKLFLFFFNDRFIFLYEQNIQI